MQSLQGFYPADPNTGIHIEDRSFIISADLGQANDWTAISVIERVVKGDGILGQDGNGERTLFLRHIERPPIGTEYPDIVERLVALFKSPALEGKEKAVVIDYTGLGRPVYDLMRQRGFRYSLNAISITGSMDANHIKGHWNVPKRDLVTRLQIALQFGELKIAKGLKEANALIEELSNFQTKITDSGRDIYGGRSGVHDDIVLSVAMGVWLGGRQHYRRSIEDLI